MPENTERQAPKIAPVVLGMLPFVLIEVEDVNEEGIATRIRCGGGIEQGDMKAVAEMLRLVADTMTHEDQSLTPTS